MPIKTSDDIQKLASSFMRSRILLTGWDLGIFTALGSRARSAEDLAAELGTDMRATDRLLGALCAAGLCEKANGLFRNAKAARIWLDAASPDYLSGLGHQSYLYQNWGTLTQAVRSGGTVLDSDFDDDARREAFIAAMHRRATKDADSLVSRLDLSRASRVLDVGGGSGVYAMAMCRANPGLTVVIFDLEPVTKLTRGYVERGELADRITTRPGDYHHDYFGSGYDLAFFSSIVHINSHDENRRLMHKAFAALRPGGQVAVVDFVMDEERLAPEFGAVFALNMLVNTPGGDVYTEGEIASWMADAGFTTVTCSPAGQTTSLMTGRKPSKH